MIDKSKKALITGIGGQDGLYLTKFLIRNNYKVFGLTRNKKLTLRKFSLEKELRSAINEGKVQVYKSLNYDLTYLFDLISKIKPDEIYNFACQSNVVKSYNQTDFNMVDDVSILSKLISVIQKSKLNSRILQASSSEIYGGNETENTLSETTKLIANSPYGLAKIYNHELIKYYRKNHSFFSCNAILFNHESIYRSDNFALKKISKGLVSIIKKETTKLIVESLDTVRDWGHASEYCEAMWKILNFNYPDDFIVATGVSASVREILEFAFSNYGLNYEDFIVTLPNKERLFNKEKIYADVSKIYNTINWHAKLTWKDVVIEMIEYEMRQ